MERGGLTGATDIVKASRQLVKEQAKEIRVVGLVQDPSDRLLLGARLAAHTEAGTAVVRPLGPDAVRDVAEADLAILVVRDPRARGVADTIAAVAERRRHTLVVVMGHSLDERDTIAARLGIPAHMVVTSPTDEVLPRAAADRALHLVGDRRLALCAAFPVFREAGAAEVISATAWQNATVATVLAVPGADMPVLTANQIKMVLKIAALHGETIGFERAKEILAVIGGGFVFRTVAREMLGFVPVLGWLVKGSVAYGGTMAVGKAAHRYFALGPEGRQGLTEKLRRRAAEVVPARSKSLASGSAGTEG